MFENESRGISPLGALLILFGMVLVGLFVGTLVAAGIWVGMTGNSIMNIEKDLSNPKFANAARVMQLVSVFIGFYVPALIAARLTSRRPFKYLGYKEGFNVKQLLLALFIMMACLPLVGALAELTQHIPVSKSAAAYFHKLEDSYDSQAEALSTIRSSAEFVFSLIVMALLPAVFEETLFRGALQQLLIKWFKTPIPAIIVASILFSLAHMSYYGFLSRFALGMVLGLMYYYSGSIWLGMAAHFANNAIVVCYMYYLSMHGKPAAAAMEDNSPAWLGIPAIIVVVALFRWFRDVSFKRNINKIPPMDGPSVQSNIA